MKRILVTGGAGFIGSHLCRALLEKGNEVICVDNFITGTRANIEDLFHWQNFQLVNHDITSPYTCEAEEIYNLACPASPVQYQQNPIKTIKTSVLGTINTLGLARKAGARILQASTSEVYGNPSVHPQPESYWGNVNPIGIRSCYDEGKRCAETLFMDYHRQHGIPIKIARIFNTYGPHMDPSDGRVVSNFIVQSLRGHDITIFGDGSQTRSFQYVGDLVDGLIRMMDTPPEVLGPVNLGNPVEYRIIDLARIVIDLTGSSSRIVFRELPGDDPERRKPDISEARKILKWEPSTSLEEGLKHTISYFKKLLEK